MIDINGMARLLLATMLMTATASCLPQGPVRTTAPPDSAAGEVGMNFVGPGGVALLVPVVINGEGPFDFVLDTGATMICLHEPLAEQLDLPVRDMQFGYQVGVQGRQNARLVDIDSFRVGAASAEGISACVLDMEMLQIGEIEASGLLGLNFLRNFHVTLDFERNIVRFQ